MVGFYGKEHRLVFFGLCFSRIGSFAVNLLDLNVTKCFFSRHSDRIVIDLMTKQTQIEAQVSGAWQQ